MHAELVYKYRVTPFAQRRLERVEIDERIVIEDLGVMVRDESHTAHVSRECENLVDFSCRTQAIFPAS